MSARRTAHGRGSLSGGAFPVRLTCKSRSITHAVRAPSGAPPSDWGDIRVSSFGNPRRWRRKRGLRRQREKAPRDRPCVEAFGRAWHTFQGLCLAGMPSAMGPTPGGVDRTKKTPEIEVPRAAKAPKASSRHARQWGEGLRRTFAAAPPGAPGGVRGSSARERAPGAARRPKRAARERGVCQQGSYSAVPIRDFAPGVGHYQPGPGRIDD